MKIGRNLNRNLEKTIDYIEQGRFNKAEKLIKQLIAIHPKIPKVQFTMGLFFAHQDKNNEAVQYFENAVKLNTVMVEAWFNLAVASKNNFDIARTIEAFQKVIDLSGNSNNFLTKTAKDFIDDMEIHIRETNNLSLEEYLEFGNLFKAGFEYLQNSEFEAAIDKFDQALQIYPNHVQTYGNLGLCYGYLGNKEKALEMLNTAIKLDPKYEPAIENKKILETLKPGGKLSDLPGISIDYYRNTFVG